jgi:hypothetical protein
MGLFDFLFGREAGRASAAEKCPDGEIESHPNVPELTRDEAIEESLGHLRGHAFADAVRVVRQHESQQSRPRGIGVDWSASGDERNVRMVEIIFQVRPQILRGLAECNWNPLRVAAAMDYLWGTNRATRWLPDGFSGIGAMGADAAARMLIFRADTIFDLRQQQELGVKKWQIAACNTSCTACRGIAEKKYTLGELPEVPYPECTHEMGCRCPVLPVFDD